MVIKIIFLRSTTNKANGFKKMNKLRLLKFAGFRLPLFIYAVNERRRFRRVFKCGSTSTYKAIRINKTLK